MTNRRQKWSIQFNWETGTLVQPASVQKGVNSGILTAPTLYWLHGSVCSTFNKWMRAEIDVDVLNRRWADSVPSGAIMWSGGGGDSLTDYITSGPGLKPFTIFFLALLPFAWHTGINFRRPKSPFWLMTSQHTKKSPVGFRPPTFIIHNWPLAFFFPVCSKCHIVVLLHSNSRSGDELKWNFNDPCG